jgi:hypothetical protein
MIRDGSSAFIGSQSLRKLELDGRREVGILVSDTRVVKQIQDVFEDDWKQAGGKPLAVPEVKLEKVKDSKAETKAS